MLLYKACVALFLLLLLHRGSVDASAVNLWPQPSSLQHAPDANSAVSLSSAFHFVQDTSCSHDGVVLPAAFERYAKYLQLNRNTHETSTHVTTSPTLTQLSVCVTGPVETPPRLQYGVNESYALHVGVSNGNGVAAVRASTVWGALRGLETFSQLVDVNATPRRRRSRGKNISNQNTISYVPIDIFDTPRFAWRGLLIDTSRHYLAMSSILRQIDALSYGKGNILHWHLVDAQSFPYQSEKYPQLSETGSWCDSCVYSPTDIASVRQYAYLRGVRVVIEVDGPGHAYSWSFAFPKMVAKCSARLSANINNFPLSPAWPNTPVILQTLFEELTEPFSVAGHTVPSDNFFHWGGDEVVQTCWTDDPTIQQWMKSQGFTSTLQVYQWFVKVQESISGTERRPMHWEEVFVNGINMRSDAVVHVWKDRDTLHRVIAGGYDGVLSAGWYLDQQVPNKTKTWYAFEDTWKSFYQNDPDDVDPVAHPTERKHTYTASMGSILGGEAAMWGEQVDDNCIDARIWPRALAVMERLWSPRSYLLTANTTSRIISMQCRMAQRGVCGSPLAAGYCPCTRNQ